MKNKLTTWNCSTDVEQSKVVRQKALQIGLSQKLLTQTQVLNCYR